MSPWETSHRKKGFVVYGFRKVGIRRLVLIVEGEPLVALDVADF